MVSAALIGVSGFGRTHCDDLLRLAGRGELTIAAATVRDESKATERVAALRAAGARIFADYHEMLDALAGSLDLCFIPTGIHLHAAMTVDALHSGANVFVEKPAAATLKQVEAMQAAERQTGRFVAVGYQTMYAPETMQMKRAISDGTIGTIEAIKCRGLWPRPDTYYTRSPWIGTLRRDGNWILDSPFNNAFAHQLNMLVFLAGETLTDTAELTTIEAELYRARDIETADTAALRIGTKSGIPLYFMVSHVSENVLDPELVVRGSAGTIRWTPARLTIERGGSIVLDTPCLTGITLRDAMLTAVLERLHKPDRFICGLDIARAQTLAANGAHLSSAVHPIPDELIQRVPHEDTLRTTVRGLDALVDRAFHDEKLPSQLGVPWAVAGTRTELDPASIRRAYPDMER